MCSLEAFYKFSDAIAPWIFGGFGIWIAFQQMAISRSQTNISETQAALQQAELKRNLFDRRYEIFSETVAFINQVMADSNDAEKCSLYSNEFTATAVKSSFLFGPEIRELLDKLLDSQSEIWTLNQEMKGAGVGSDELKKKLKARSDQVKSLRATLKILEDKFAPYISIRENLPTKSV